MLVVNNACSDDTSVVVASFAERLPLRETYEAEPGVAMARNRAVLESTGTHLAFIDDDILVEKTWLTALAELVTRYPESAAFGGPVRAYFSEAPNPALAAAFPYLRRGFCSLDYNRQEGPLPDGLLPAGANMVFRKASLNGLKFDPRLGVKRDLCAGHEDVALLSRLRADGGSIMWSPQLSVGHYVDPSRTTAAYLARHARDRASSRVLAFGVPAGRQLFGVPLHILLGLGVSRLAYESLRLTPFRRLRLRWMARAYRFDGKLRGCRESAIERRHTVGRVTGPPEAPGA